MTTDCPTRLSSTKMEGSSFCRKLKNEPAGGLRLVPATSNSTNDINMLAKRGIRHFLSMVEKIVLIILTPLKGLRTGWSQPRVPTQVS